MSDEPTMTGTQVKTKTVSATKMAIALAFLGVSALAAAATTTPMVPDGKGAPVCNDTDVATVNAAGMPLATYQYVNLGQKGATTGLGSNGLAMIGEDKCWSGTRILEYFCNVKKNIVTWNSYNCPTGTSCKDGACIAPFTSGKINFKVSALSSTDLTNSSQTLGEVVISALDEDITLNSLKFTLFIFNNDQFSSTVVSNLYLTEYKDGVYVNLAGPVSPVSVVSDTLATSTYYVTFDNLNLLLPQYSPSLINWQRKFTLQGSISGAANGFVGVRINPMKDVVGTGMKSGLKIFSSPDQLLVVSNLVGAVVEVAKTCDDALKNPDSFAMFGFCKEKGYKSVCFNKYTLAYQVCSDENGTGCITTEVPNAASNIRCLTSAIDYMLNDL